MSVSCRQPWACRSRASAPFVVADAVTSRQPESRDRALDRVARDGVEVVTTEMVLFEWFERAGTAEFKQLSAPMR